jgi:hypothetical protein
VSGRRWICGSTGIEREGLGGLLNRPRGAGREAGVAGDPGADPGGQAVQSAGRAGLSHWSSREMVAYIKRTERVDVSHHYVAKLWREVAPAAVGDVHGLPGSAVRRESRRHRRVVPRPARRRGLCSALTRKPSRAWLSGVKDLDTAHYRRLSVCGVASAREAIGVARSSPTGVGRRPAA